MKHPHDDMVTRFVNHPPETEKAAELLDKITDHMIGLSFFLVTNLPEGREKSLAITKLEECSMWSKAAVARNQNE